jgi:transposase
LTRYRKTLVQERAQEVNRLHKVLETANVKLTAVATDVLGKSGRAMLEALISGTTDAEILADASTWQVAKKASRTPTSFGWANASPSSDIAQAYPGSS